MSHLTSEFIKKMQNVLEQKKKQLSEDIAGINPHTEEGSGLDESAQEVAEDAVNQDVLAALSAELGKVNAALQKIHEGTYGIDSEGKQISVERLEALPWADKAL